MCLGMFSHLKRSIPDLRSHKTTHQPLIGKLNVSIYINLLVQLNIKIYP